MICPSASCSAGTLADGRRGADHPITPIKRFNLTSSRFRTQIARLIYLLRIQENPSANLSRKIAAHDADVKRKPDRAIAYLELAGSP